MLNSTKKQKEKIEKIKKNISKIQKVIDKQGKHGYYLFDGDTVKLVSKGHDKADVDESVLEKLNGKKQYVNKFIYLVDVIINPKYIGKEDDIIDGPVSLRIKQFQITKTFKMVHKADFKYGAVWYTNKDIENDTFSFTDIKQIIHNIHTKNIEIIGVGGVRAVDVLQDSDEETDSVETVASTDTTDDDSDNDSDEDSEDSSD
ncbi:hypothetical protein YASMINEVIRUS_1540 [Yasminevirus sp. GU-2018]|uniref:Uncharacterized protein n=1 Tax=Yasminevirus sp. GU-2018 TaxID=2420051 RepID=A0A5K0UAG0_9VIRU|nr:hypothetical protein YASMINEVIRUS_1540 [Yasminevirus sp. GU-2018]